jgi:hypothetical protein
MLAVIAAIGISPGFSSVRYKINSVSKSCLSRQSNADTGDLEVEQGLKKRGLTGAPLLLRRIARPGI